MHAFIKRIFYFGGFILGLMFLLNLWLKHNTRADDYYALQYKEVFNPKKSAECVIMGNSHATHGIQPKILDELGSTFYNFALNGAGFSFYLAWYQQVFKPYYNKPKYVIINVDWFSFNRKMLWRKYEHDAEYYPFQLFLKSLSNEKFNYKMLFENRYPILKYRKIIMYELFYPNRGPNFFPIDKYDNGFIPFQRLVQEELQEFYPISDVHNDSERKDFEELVHLLVNDGIKVIFCVIPTFNKVAAKYENVETYKYLDLVADHYEIPILNYNTNKRSFINSDSTLYTDGGHLSNKGSLAFTQMFKEDLRPLIR